MKRIVLKGRLLNLYIVVKKILVYFICTIIGNRILTRIRKKPKKKVIFFAINLGMWKFDELFKLLLNSKEFDPYIVSFLYPEDSPNYQEWVQNSMKKYFESKNFPFIEIFDFSKNKWFDLQAFDPDIIFYAQPYNAGYRHLHLESFMRKSLFAYLPYGFDIENMPIFYNTVYLNICKRLYYPTIFHKEFEGDLLYNKGKNIVVCGNPVVERIARSNVDFTSIWKIKNTNLKRVIWAPHHSITTSDTLHYSNFLMIADDMIELAKKYNNKIQFAFKPHPRLKVKLYTQEGWGKERTDTYYNQWDSLSNTMFVEGDYVDLFISSDAMIHDCSTFTAEYLATGHPVMFMGNGCNAESLNQFGLDCFNLHYKGENIDNIEVFINNVVLNNNDSLLEKRKEFIDNVLLQKEKKRYEDIIFEDMKQVFC